jgi:predicted HicB family RNase H-like nuclease
MNALLMPNTSKSPGGRRKDPSYKQLNLNLPPELIKKLRLLAVEEEISMSELAEKIFKDYLNKD